MSWSKVTGAEFKTYAIKLYGDKWKAAVAAELRTSEITVWRYSKQAVVPWLVEKAMAGLAKTQKPRPTE